MKHYGLTIAEGTQISNITVAQGTSFPADENAGEMFFRTDESKLYIYDGIQWTEVGSGGATTPTTYYYTSSSSQTTFSGADNNANVLSYEVGQIYVYVNGVLIEPPEYTATNGTHVILAEAASLDDLITIMSLTNWSNDILDGGSF